MSTPIETIPDLIARTEMFAGLTEDQLELIGGCGRLDRFDSGEYLLREGEPADSFYVIRSGRVGLEVHGPGSGALMVATLDAGEVAGWSWLFEPYRAALDVRTVEPCALVVFDGPCLREKCDSDHELGYQLMRRFAHNMADALMATRLQLLDIYGHAHA